MYVLLLLMLRENADRKCRRVETKRNGRLYLDVQSNPKRETRRHQSKTIFLRQVLVRGRMRSCLLLLLAAMVRS